MRLNLYTFFYSVLGCFASHSANADIIIVPISGASSHSYSYPYSGKFKAINGESFDVSSLYTSSSLEFFLKGLIFWDVRNNITLKVPWSIDLGYESEVFITEPVLQLGLSVVYLFENKSVEFGVTNLISIGGQVNETPCVDRLFREFHCGTGLPWVDKPDPLTNNTMTYQVEYRIVF